MHVVDWKVKSCLKGRVPKSTASFSSVLYGKVEPFFFLIYLFFGLLWVFVAVSELSLVVASGGYSSLCCTGFSLLCLLLLWSTGSRHSGFSSRSTQAQ